MHAKTSGVFLTIEGIEGVGKSTALHFIQDCLKNMNVECVTTREPGGTELAEKIRQILLFPNTSETVLPQTELLLMFASRAQHIANVVVPALQAGKWLVSDRFVDASFAYQGGGRQLDLQWIRNLEQWIVGEVQPTLTFLLDAPAEIGLARAKHRGPEDRIESEKIEFFKRVRDVYLMRAKENPARFRIIDATQDLATVQREIKRYLHEIEVMV